MFAAAAAAVLILPPTPYELIEAEQLTRCPDLYGDRPVDERRRRAAEVVAVRDGLIGERERLTWPHDGVGYWYAGCGYHYLAYLRTNLDRCPPLTDADRLPPYDWCAAAVEWNCGLAAGYRARAKWEPDRSDRLAAGAEAAGEAADFWRLVAKAADHQESAATRRHALRRVREAVGAERYDRGEFPDAGPFWLLLPR